jgi:hypothetical protein
VTTQVKRHLARSDAIEKAEFIHQLVFFHRADVVRRKSLSTPFRIPVVAAMHELIRSNMCKRTLDAAVNALSFDDPNLGGNGRRSLIPSKTLDALVNAYAKKHPPKKLDVVMHPLSGVVALGNLASRLVLLRQPAPRSLFGFAIKSLVEARQVALATRLWVAWADSPSAGPASAEFLQLIVRRTVSAPSFPIGQATAVVQILSSLVAARKLEPQLLPIALLPIALFPDPSASSFPSLPSLVRDTRKNTLSQKELDSFLKLVWSKEAFGEPTSDVHQLYGICRSIMREIVECVEDSQSATSSTRRPRRPPLWLTNGNGDFQGQELPERILHMVLIWAIRDRGGAHARERLLELLGPERTAPALDIVLEQATADGDDALALAIIDELSSIGLTCRSVALVLKFYFEAGRRDDLLSFMCLLVTYFGNTLSFSSSSSPFSSPVPEEKEQEEEKETMFQKASRVLPQDLSRDADVYCTLLHMAENLGKTGMAERIWMLAKRAEEEDHQSIVDDASNDVDVGDIVLPSRQRRTPMRLPISAYSTMMRVYADEGHKAFPEFPQVRSRSQPYVRGWVTADDDDRRWKAARESGWRLYQHLVLERKDVYGKEDGGNDHDGSAATPPPKPEPDKHFFSAAIDLFGRTPGLPARLREEAIVREGDLAFVGDERMHTVIRDASERGFPVPWAYTVVSDPKKQPHEVVVPPPTAIKNRRSLPFQMRVRLPHQRKQRRRRGGMEEPLQLASRPV